MESKLDERDRLNGCQAADQSEDDFMLGLLRDGKRVEATSQLIDISKKPDYFDQDRFKRAQKTCQKYYTNISLASSTGLMMLLQVESILIPLLKSGKSRTVVDLYDRYTATARFVRKWYESDFPEAESEGRKAINLVRSMHQRIHKFMNSPQTQPATGVAQNGPPSSVLTCHQATTIKGEHELWVNQHDMALTQFAFIGLFLLYPEKCVAYHITRDELRDIVYYWRLISYYLGIEERFNIFAYHDDLDRQLKLMEVLLEHMNSLRSQPQYDAGKRMAEGFMLAFEDFNKESSFSILNNWWLPQISLSGDHKPRAYTLGDRWKLLFFLFYFRVLFRSELLMSYLNNAYKRKFDKFCAEGERIKPKLANKYKDIVYE